MKGHLPGFQYDSKRKLARFEVILPGTGSRARKRKTVGAKTRADALEKWKTFRGHVLAGGGEVPTLKGYVEDFWEVSSARLSKSARQTERSILDAALLPFFGESRLDRINIAEVRDFVGEKKAQGYAPATINGFLTILRKLLRDATERNVIAAYPIRGRLPREKDSPLHLELANEEHEKFVAAFEDEAAFRADLAKSRHHGGVATSPHFGGQPRSFGGGLDPAGKAAGVFFERFRSSKPLFVVALETGLRRGDILALKWSAVDLRAGWIRITTGKTKQEVAIPISDACREALLESKRRPVLGELVFVSEEGRPFSVPRLEGHFALAKRIACISRRLRFHDLRHTFASRLASAGVSIQIIAKALGHTSVRMSERYARPSEDSMRAIREALNGETNSLANSETKKAALACGLSPSESVVRPPRFERGTFRSGV